MATCRSLNFRELDAILFPRKTKKYMKNFFILIILLLSITSCTHTYYVQTTQIVPLFKEKNETQATLSYGQADEVYTTDLQAAHSFTDHFALMTNVMFVSGGSSGSGRNSGTGEYIDLAGGYFTPLGKHGVFEIYGGAGGSNQRHQYEKGKSADLSFKKVFIQPSIGLTYNAFDIAVTSGLSNVNFNDIRNPRNISQVELIAKNSNSFLFEPALTMRVGWKSVKLQGQVGMSHNLSHSDLAFEPFKLSIGLTFTFAERLSMH
jgi:hypothetical protein